MFLSICFSIFPYFFGATWPIQGSERRADITSLLYVLRWWWPLPSSWRQPWNLAPEIQRFIYGWKARIHSLSAFIELLLLFIAHQPPFFPNCDITHPRFSSPSLVWAPRVSWPQAIHRPWLEPRIQSRSWWFHMVSAPKFPKLGELLIPC